MVFRTMRIWEGYISLSSPNQSSFPPRYFLFNLIFFFFSILLWTNATATRLALCRYTVTTVSANTRNGHAKNYEQTFDEQCFPGCLLGVDAALGRNSRITRHFYTAMVGKKKKKKRKFLFCFPRIFTTIIRGCPGWAFSTAYSYRVHRPSDHIRQSHSVLVFLW